MAKIALITDTHFGVRNDSSLFADYFSRFYKETFFPYLKEHGIKNVVHLGDIVDRRKYINYMTVDRLEKDFILPCVENDIKLTVLIGNHDVFYKNTNEINCMDQLYGKKSSYSNIDIIESPKEKDFYGTKILLMPWICADNYTKSMEMINHCSSEICFGHFEIQGFEMHRGHYNEIGFQHSLFSRFKKVFSGHFHHRSSNANITYLGCPYEITWSDYGDKKGFHIFDTETFELTFIENPFKIFHKISYNDSNFSSLEELINSFDFSFYKNSYVKVFIEGKKNPHWFDAFFEVLEKSEIQKIQVIESSLDVSAIDNESLLADAEDTLTIMSRFIEQIDDKNLNKEKVNSFFVSLYNEALLLSSQ